MMITIYRDKTDIPQGKIYVELNDIFFNQHTVSKLDERAASIVKKIDASKLISKYKIQSRFDDIVLNVDQLSVGCKTVLNVLYNPEIVFCLKECGNNALEELYSLENGAVYSDYALIPFQMREVMVQTKNNCQRIDDYEKLKEWWNHEE